MTSAAFHPPGCYSCALPPPMPVPVANRCIDLVYTHYTVLLTERNKCTAAAYRTHILALCSHHTVAPPTHVRAPSLHQDTFMLDSRPAASLRLQPSSTTPQHCLTVCTSKNGSGLT